MEPFVREVSRLREESARWGQGEHRERHAIHARQLEGLTVHVEGASGTGFTLDEPRWFGGDEQGPNPAEALLGALAASLGVTIRVYAGLLGIPIARTETDVVGDLDLRGFIDPVSEQRSGFESISVRMRVLLSPEPGPGTDVADGLRKSVERCCPILDAVRGATEVDVEIDFSSIPQEAGHGVDRGRG